MAAVHYIIVSVHVLGPVAAIPREITYPFLNFNGATVEV